jgi:hypothetical protein
MKHLFWMLAFVSGMVLAQSNTDNLIQITQTGDNLTLTIDQDGYGNKIAGDAQYSTDMVITGGTVELNIDQIGNLNRMYSTIISDNSTLNITFTGDSNIMDWRSGATGSADSMEVDIDVTGSSNNFDVDHAAQDSAERLDFDLTLIGSTNTWNIDIESDDAVWNWDYTGDDGDILTSQSDGAYHEINMTFDGDDADIDIIQSSGTCATGITSCYSVTTMDVTSDNATITINQTD